MPPRPFRLVAAPFTPFAANGDLELSVVEEQADLLAHNDVASAFVGGTTGECMSLSVAERRMLAETWIRAAVGRLGVIVHVGHNCQRDAIELARHADRSGAAAIAATAPCFVKPADVESLVDFCEPIAAAAPDLPFYYYHLPSITGVALPMVNFLQVAGRRIPNLVGMKYSHDDLSELSACVAFDNERYEILFGRDESLLAALALGVRGAIGSTYNFMAPLYHRLIAAFDSGDLPAAQAEQGHALQLARSLARFGPAAFAASKAVMRWVGVDCGSVRSPLRQLSSAQSDQLAGELSRLGFDAICAKTAGAAAARRTSRASRTPVLR